MNIRLMLRSCQISLLTGRFWEQKYTETQQLRWTRRSPCQYTKIGRKTAGAGHLRNRRKRVENRGFFAFCAVQNARVMILPYPHIKSGSEGFFVRSEPKMSASGGNRFTEISENLILTIYSIYAILLNRYLYNISRKWGWHSYDDMLCFKQASKQASRQASKQA